MGSSLFNDLLPVIGTAIGGYYGGASGAMLGGTLGEGVGGALTSQQAAQQEQNAANQALQFEQGVYGNTQQQIAPYQQAGNAALNKMMGLLGLGGLSLGGGYGGYGGYGMPSYSVPPSHNGGFTASQGGSPAFGTGGGVMPGAMTPTGMGTTINAGGGQNLGYGAGDYTGAGIYGPQTMNFGGQTITGNAGTGGLGGVLGGAAGALIGGPMGAALGYKLGSGGGNTFTFTDPATGKTVTAQGATNVQPTQVTVPKTTMTTPGQIIDPKTGGPIGAAYYSTPVGEQAAFHQAIANGQMQSEAQNALINAAHGQLRQRRKYGGPAGDPALPASVTVGEDGPETVHMMPGSMAWVEPNPGTMEKMRKGTHLPRSGGNGLPGRLLGGMIGNMGGAPGGNLANSLALKRQAMAGQPPASGPVQNAIGGPQNTMGYSTTAGSAGTSAASNYTPINPSTYVAPFTGPTERGLSATNQLPLTYQGGGYGVGSSAAPSGMKSITPYNPAQQAAINAGTPLPGAMGSGQGGIQAVNPAANQLGKTRYAGDTGYNTGIAGGAPPPSWLTPTIPGGMGGTNTATWRPTGSAGGFGSNLPSNFPGAIQNGPGGAIGGSSQGTGNGSFNPWASNSSSQLTGGQTPSDILSQDPSYQFRFQQGLQALQNSAIARGTGLSGGYMRGAEEFGSGLASQEFGNIYSRLAALSGSGLSATGIGSQAGASLAFPYGMASMYGGSAGAQGTLGSFNAMGQGLGNLAFLYGQNNVPSYGTTGGYSSTPTTDSGFGYTPGMYGDGSNWGSNWLYTGGGG